MKNMTNNAIYIAQDLHTFSFKVVYKSFHLHQCFHYILQLDYQLVSFYIYNSHNLNILQNHMIYHIQNLI